MSENEIVSQIKKGGAAAESAIRFLFKKHQGFMRDAQKRHQLSEEEVLDAYTDALLALRKQILTEQFRGESKVSTYFYPIFQRRCVDRIRKKATHKRERMEVARTEATPEPVDEAAQADQQMITRERFEKLMTYMQQLGEQCRQILMYRYYYGYEDMAEIARLTGVKNANTAGSLRYRCMQQLMKRIHNLKNT